MTRMVPPHRKINKDCKLCGKYHTKSQHAHHGDGACRRVHKTKKSKYC